MQEIFNLINIILFLPIPFPFAFDNILYFNLFGVIIVFFLIGLVSFIIRKLSAGAGD